MRGEYYKEVSTSIESFYDINQLGAVLEDSKKGIQDKKDGPSNVVREQKGMSTEVVVKGE